MAAAQIKGLSAASDFSHMLFLLMLHALPVNQHPNDGGNGLDEGDSLELPASTLRFPFDVHALRIFVIT